MFKKLLYLLIALLVLVACGTSTPSETGTPSETDNVPAGDVAINVYTRDSSSGTREAFEGGVNLEELTVDAVETSGNGDMAQKVGVDEHGIGYVSLTTDFEANNLTPVHFEGVEPNFENVLDQSYTLSRPFSYVTRAADDFSGDVERDVVAAFIDFLNHSTEGLEAVEAAGGIVDLSAAKDWSELSANHPVLDSDVSTVTIRTSGSTSVEKTIQVALEAFQAETGVQFVMNHTGSGDGFKRVLGEEKDSANAADIGFASRTFKTDGSEEVSAGLAQGYYALDAVVVVVSQDNTNAPESLTADQISKIFGGEIKHWNDLN